MNTKLQHRCSMKLFCFTFLLLHLWKYTQYGRTVFKWLSASLHKGFFF